MSKTDTLKHIQTTVINLQINEKTAEKEGHNELDEKEQLYYRPHEYLIKVLNSINIDSITTKEQHYKYLLLNILFNKSFSKMQEVKV